MIKLTAATLIKDDSTILAPVTTTLSERRIGIIGLNGSGKSSFARLLNGLEAPTTGTVSVGSYDTQKDRKQVLNRVGFVFQNPDLQMVYPTVAEDLAYGLAVRGVKKVVQEAQVQDMLQRFDVAHLAERMVYTLSGGEKQLIAVLGVLITEPDILVLDEPTTLLDLKHTRRFMAMIRGLAQQVILVTHDVQMLTGFDRVLCFHHGTVVQDGPVAHVVPYYQDVLCAAEEQGVTPDAD